MRIIDNKKDYYDYLAGVWGIDGHITYDRRNSKRLVNKTASIIDERYPMGYAEIFCTWKNGRDPEYDYVNLSLIIVLIIVIFTMFFVFHVV